MDIATINRLAGIATELGFRRAVPLIVLIAFCFPALSGCGGGATEPVTEETSPAVTSPEAESSPTVAKTEPRTFTPAEVTPTERTDTTPADSPFSDVEAPVVQPVFRPADRRPSFDDAVLAKHGIRRYESTHLRLYTDIDPEIAKTLPPVIDESYAAWEAYFGKLPPNPKRTPFQMNGFIMADKELFRNAGLLPGNLPGFRHGRHRGAEFWMNDQKDDYFRQHLMIHEATHCFMTIMPNPPADVWYLEGMAELFGTHARLPNGELRFGVIPPSKDGFDGWARFRMIQDEIKAGRQLSFDDVLKMVSEQFIQEEYAWAWAVCLLLERHPRYHDKFRELGWHQADGKFSDVFYVQFNKEFPDIREEWLLMLPHLKYGFNAEQAAIEWKPGRPLTETVAVKIDSARGWQSSGVTVEKGQTYHITASGRFTLADQPKPWVSEAGGISIRYVAGRPIGQLLAAIREEPPGSDPRGSSMFDEYVIGAGSDLTAPITGTLYFRVNDDLSELFDNAGLLDLKIQAAD